MPRIIEAELSYKLTGIFFNVQNELGRFCRERQYGDAIEKALIAEKIPFVREQALSVADRKSNFVDFIIAGKIVIELKSKPFITKEDYLQTQRYLNSANLELGIIVNFHQDYLKPKRVLNSKLEKNENAPHSGHSDEFVD